MLYIINIEIIVSDKSPKIYQLACQELLSFQRDFLLIIWTDKTALINKHKRNQYAKGKELVKEHSVVSVSF